VFKRHDERLVCQSPLTRRSMQSGASQPTVTEWNSNQNILSKPALPIFLLTSIHVDGRVLLSTQRLHRLTSKHVSGDSYELLSSPAQPHRAVQAISPVQLVLSRGCCPHFGYISVLHVVEAVLQRRLQGSSTALAVCSVVSYGLLHVDGGLHPGHRPRAGCMTV
jgi:hypothetical protein